MFNGLLGSAVLTGWGEQGLTKGLLLSEGTQIISR